MVKTMVNLGNHEDRVLSVVKGKYGFSNKSDAVNFVIDKFEEELLEPELRPEYVKKIQRIGKGKFKSYKSLDDLDKDIDNA